jgi:hypothetical protein
MVCPILSSAAESSIDDIFLGSKYASKIQHRLSAMASLACTMLTDLISTQLWGLVDRLIIYADG